MFLVSRPLLLCARPEVPLSSSPFFRKRHRATNLGEDRRGSQGFNTGGESNAAEDLNVGSGLHFLRAFSRFHAFRLLNGRTDNVGATLLGVEHGRARCAATGVSRRLSLFPYGHLQLRSAECYDPSAKAWHDITPLPEEASRLCLAARKGLPYAIGGSTRVPNHPNHRNGMLRLCTNVICYSPERDAWESMELGRHRLARGLHGAAAVAAMWTNGRDA